MDIHGNYSPSKLQIIQENLLIHQETIKSAKTLTQFHSGLLSGAGLNEAKGTFVLGRELLSEDGSVFDRAHIDMNAQNRIRLKPSLCETNRERCTLEC